MSSCNLYLQVLKSLTVAAKEGLFISGVMMVFFTYSVAGVILPSLMTKYVAKSMMVSKQIMFAEKAWRNFQPFQVNTRSQPKEAWRNFLTSPSNYLQPASSAGKSVRAGCYIWLVFKVPRVFFLLMKKCRNAKPKHARITTETLLKNYPEIGIKKSIIIILWV